MGSISDRWSYGELPSRSETIAAASELREPPQWFGALILSAQQYELLADGLGLDYFIKIVGLVVVADEMGIALAAMIVDGGCLEVIVYDNK